MFSFEFMVDFLGVFNVRSLLLQDMCIPKSLKTNDLGFSIAYLISPKDHLLGAWAPRMNVSGDRITPIYKP